MSSAGSSEACLGFSDVMALTRDANFHRHAHECVCHPHETARNRHDLCDVASDGDGDQVEAANVAVGRIEGDPASAGHVNLRPGMSRAGTGRSHDAFAWIEKITGDNSHAEPEAACRFRKENSEVPAGSPSTVQGLERRLSALIVTALIRYPYRDTSAEVLQQRKRVGRVAAYEPLSPVAQLSGRIRILLRRKRPKVGPLLIGVSERLGDR